MGGMSQSQMFAQAQAQAAVSGKTAAAASLANGKKDEKNEKPEGDKGVNEEEKKEKLATNGNAIPEKIKYTDKKEEKKDVKPIEKSEDKEKSEGENPWGEDKEEKKGSNPWADDVSDEGEKKDEDKGEFIEDAKPKRYSLYIKGLPTPTTEEELKAVVGESGQKAIQVKIIFDQFTKQQKVGCYDSMLWTRANLAQDFGYLDFDSEEVMNEALKASTGVSFSQVFTQLHAYTCGCRPSGIPLSMSVSQSLPSLDTIVASLVDPAAVVVATSEVEVEVSALALERREVNERALVLETPLLVERKRRDKGLNECVHVEEEYVNIKLVDRLRAMSVNTSSKNSGPGS